MAGNEVRILELKREVFERCDRLQDNLAEMTERGVVDPDFDALWLACEEVLAKYITDPKVNVCRAQVEQEANIPRAPGDKYGPG